MNKYDDSGPSIPNNNPLIPEIEIKNRNHELEESDLLSIYNNWKTIRLLYPGWEILPSSNRKTLWRSTRQFYNDIYWNFEKLRNPNDINLLYELVWRINNCLIPLDTNYRDLIIRVVDKYNPFPDLIPNVESKITFKNPEYRKFDWDEISQHWIELIVTLIIDYRHDLDEKLFHKWINIIASIKEVNTEINLRIYFEKSLFYLNQFKESELRNTLSEWPESKDFPFYQAKKASIFAELGEINIAKEIAERALLEIRNQIHHSGIDYKLMSQEGWVILLLNIIYGNSWNRSETYFQNSERLEKLLFYRCNPYNDIESQVADLESSQPLLNKTRTEKKTFDPDIINISKSFGETEVYFEKLFPAFNLLFIYEKSCLPMRSGIVTVYDNSIFKASKWIKILLPIWSLSSFLRSGNTKYIDEFFSRIYIATLSESDIEFIYDTFSLSLKNCLENITLNAEKLSFITDRYLFTIISSSSECLSRISIRLSESKLHELLKLAIKMYNHPFFRKDDNLHKYVNIMFRRILFSFSSNMLITELKELILLPITNEKDFSFTYAHDWPEPFNFLDFDDDYKISKELDLPNITRRVYELIEFVKSNDRFLRINSIARLSKLFQINGLDKEQKSKFLKALWIQPDEKTGLPTNTNWYSFSFLNFSILSKTETKKRIRNLLLKEVFPRVINKNYSKEGKIINRSGFDHSQSVKYINNLINSTKPLFSVEKNINQNYVDWTNKEIASIADNLLIWWNEEKEDLSENDKHPLYYGKGEIRAAFEVVDHLLSRVILPKILALESSTINKLEDLIREMTENRFSMLGSKVLLLSLKKNQNLKHEIYERIFDGLNSTYENVIENAVDGAFLWIVYYQKRKVVKYPFDILKELLMRLSSRRQPGLFTLFVTVNKIIKYLPQILTEGYLNILEASLKYLIADTQYPTKEMLEIQSSENNLPFTYEEIPTFRELSSQLAFNLYIYHEKMRKKMPDIIIRWRNEALNDPLPEVRNYWK